jgi:hypothetical protein
MSGCFLRHRRRGGRRERRAASDPERLNNAAILAEMTLDFRTSFLAATRWQSEGVAFVQSLDPWRDYGSGRFDKICIRETEALPNSFYNSITAIL